ncbi:MAG: DoxX family protein [Siphonobacter sp.]
MKPLIILLCTYVVTLLFMWFWSYEWYYRFAGNLGMSAMLLFTAIGHFAFSKGMVMMIPAIIPYKKQLVWFTGILEILAAIGLLIPDTRHQTAGALLIFFILILPANIYAAQHHIDYQKGTKDGDGLNYLWFRVPLQLFFIGWVWYFSW